MPPKKPKQAPTIKPSTNPYPAPFDKASDSLSPLLAQLDPSKVYITHIDRTTIDHKKLIFTLTVLVNATVAVLLAWRFYVAAPKYLALGQTITGTKSSETVDTENTTSSEQIWILFRRTAMFVGDYLLARLVVPWPWSFFLERPANPVTWRWTVGIRKEEVVVRVCRNWEGKDLIGGEKKGGESAFFKTRIQPAIGEEMVGKTGYLMMDGSWDLDFGVMQDAFAIVQDGKIKMKELNRVVLVHMDGAGWLAWRFGAKEAETDGVGGDENTRKMMALKDLLTKMGKESLFWKWQEIVEDERSKDGDFTAEAQKRVAVRVDEVFKKEGVDFKEAMESVGEVQPVNARNG